MYRDDAEVADGSKVFLQDQPNLKHSQALVTGQERELTVIRRETRDPRFALQADASHTAPLELRYLVPKQSIKPQVPLEPDVDWILRNAVGLVNHAEGLRAVPKWLRASEIEQRQAVIESKRETGIGWGAVCRIHAPALFPREILSEPDHFSRPAVIVGVTDDRLTLWVSSKGALGAFPIDHRGTPLKLARKGALRDMRRRSFVRYYCREMLGLLEPHNLKRVREELDAAN
jgi:hypothetical protein